MHVYILTHMHAIKEPQTLMHGRTHTHTHTHICVIFVRVYVHTHGAKTHYQQKPELVTCYNHTHTHTLCKSTYNKYRIYKNVYICTYIHIHTHIRKVI
jgi:hypothetical protein